MNQFSTVDYRVNSVFRVSGLLFPENPAWVYPHFGTYERLTDSFVLYEITSLLELTEFAFLA